MILGGSGMGMRNGADPSLCNGSPFYGDRGKKSTLLVRNYLQYHRLHEIVASEHLLETVCISVSVKVIIQY